MVILLEIPIRLTRYNYPEPSTEGWGCNSTRQKPASAILRNLKPIK